MLSTSAHSKPSWLLFNLHARRREDEAVTVTASGGAAKGASRWRRLMGGKVLQGWFGPWRALSHASARTVSKSSCAWARGLALRRGPSRALCLAPSLCAGPSHTGQMR